jgi:microcystin-dependent protein
MSSPFVGEIRMYGFAFAPRGWALCNGQALAILQNQALFSLLGTTYGGNGVTTFSLPDLRGRVPVSFGAMPGGVTMVLGQAGGAETVTLNATTTPQHSHQVAATTTTANKRPPAGKLFAADNASVADYYRSPTAPVALDSRSLSNTGGSQPHNNMQPYTVTNYCIALQGLFPSRN